MSKHTMGWDIGGAHLKAVLLDEQGAVLQVLQLPCPLWKGLDQLETAITHTLHAFKIAPAEAQHAVTMTGELVDLFANRHEGVIAIATLAAKLLGKDTMFYAANAGFVALERVSALAACIASTNWHASASALAMQVQDALFIDIGSTTTDIIAIAAGRVLENGLSDAARMAADSLVYTGVVRTPVMALAQKLSFEGAQINVAAEYFATMADVYRLTGELTTDNAETADGQGKTELESARRLARMVGHDVETMPIETWKNLAQTCKTMQMQQIKLAVVKHLKPGMTIIGAGAGSFLVQQIANELKQAYQPMPQGTLSQTHSMSLIHLLSVRLAGHVNLNLKQDLEVCFPAFAVALLAKIQLARQYA
jgi:(4-(4-[2-(gamma-L-glutamylamino)ethyl]phenoxymethyl)furan-2-yl)methanamine synthase